jgi:plasmid stabilization system protein ParE
MKRIVSFHFLAEQELNDAANYYNVENTELGKAFLKEIDRVIKFIAEYPEAAPLVNRMVRRKLVKKFPYAVLYYVRDDRVRILAIMNQKRRPFYWIGRI